MGSFEDVCVELGMATAPIGSDISIEVTFEDGTAMSE